MQNYSFRWTQPYTTWQPVTTQAQPQEQVIEQDLDEQDLAEAREVLARIMSL